MSVWERIDRHGEAHQLDQKADRSCRHRFSALMDARGKRLVDDPDDLDEGFDHLEVGGTRNDGTGIRSLGSIWDLHGPTGVCRCCHGRNLHVAS